MIPSVLACQVRQGIEDFLRTTFPTTTPFFHGMLDRFLDDEKGMFRGPYISVQLPFRTSEGGTDFFPEIPLRYKPYLHQEKAFRRLSGEKSRSMLVATGTGSGKTECFLYPILDYCRRHRGEPGIKAILIYPMNALASDQALRVAGLIHDTPALRGNVTAGLYVGDRDQVPALAMGPKTVITNKETLCLSPPDILLTNYKMLDYLLIRPRDAVLWAGNGPETLKYLVVDELHTFDGAQGTDLACLVRRLKARLHVKQEHLCCIGTSATLGSEEERGSLRSYAGIIFGEAFKERIEEAAEKLQMILAAEIEALRNISFDQVKRFIAGFATYLRHRGALVHEGLFPYIEDGGNTYCITMIRWMPSFGKFTRAPIFLADGRSTRFDRLLSGTRTTWYGAWAQKTLPTSIISIADECDRIYFSMLRVLVEAGILVEMQAKGNKVWGLSPEALIIDTSMLPNKLSFVLSNVKSKNQDKFPYTFIKFIENHGTELLEGFIKIFSKACSSDPDAEISIESCEHLKRFLDGGGESSGSLRYQIMDGLLCTLKEREALERQVRILKERIKKKESDSLKDLNYENELHLLKREKNGIQQLIQTLVEKNIFNFFTDEGLIPNYSFPEAGVTLHSIIYRRKEKTQAGKGAFETASFDYVRPAAAAIAELVPSSTFYAGGRHVKVDQVEVSLSPVEQWLGRIQDFPGNR